MKEQISANGLVTRSQLGSQPPIIPLVSADYKNVAPGNFDTNWIGAQQMMRAYSTTLSDALKSMADMYRKKAEKLTTFVGDTAAIDDTATVDSDEAEYLTLPMYLDADIDQYIYVGLTKQQLKQAVDDGTTTVQRIVDDDTTQPITVTYAEIERTLSDQIGQLRSNEAIFEYFASHSPSAQFSVAELTSYAKSYTGISLDPNSVILQSTQSAATVLQAVKNALSTRIFTSKEEKFADEHLPNFDDADYAGGSAFGLAFIGLWNKISSFFSKIDFNLMKIGQFFKQVFSAVGDMLKWIVGRLFPNLTSDYEVIDDPVNHILECPIFSFHCSLGNHQTNGVTKTSTSTGEREYPSTLYWPTLGSYPLVDTQRYPTIVGQLACQVLNGAPTVAGNPVAGALPSYASPDSYASSIDALIQHAIAHEGQVETFVFPQITVVVKYTKVVHHGQDCYVLDGQVYARTNPLKIRTYAKPTIGPAWQEKAYDWYPPAPHSGDRYRWERGIGIKPEMQPSVDNSDNAAIVNWMTKYALSNDEVHSGSVLAQAICTTPTFCYCKDTISAYGHVAKVPKCCANGLDIDEDIVKAVFDVSSWQADNTPAGLWKSIKYTPKHPLVLSMLEETAHEESPGHIIHGGVQHPAQIVLTEHRIRTDFAGYQWYTIDAADSFGFSIISMIAQSLVDGSADYAIYQPHDEFIEVGTVAGYNAGDYVSAAHLGDYQGYSCGSLYIPRYNGFPSDHSIHPQTDAERIQEVYDVLKIIAGAAAAVGTAVTSLKIRKKFRRKRLEIGAKFDQAKLDYVNGLISGDDLWKAQKKAKRWGALSDAVAATANSSLDIMSDNLSPISNDVIESQVDSVDSKLMSFSDATSSEISSLQQQINTLSAQLAAVDNKTTAALAEISATVVASGADIIVTVTTLRALQKTLTEVLNRRANSNTNGNWYSNS